MQELVVDSLAHRRKELQHLADINLPSNVLAEAQVRLQPNVLLGYCAGTLWQLLKSHGVETNFTEDEDWLIYGVRNMDVQLAEILWNAGFKDVDEPDDQGFTQLMLDNFRREDGYYSLQAFDKFVSFTNWLIQKGADPYRKRLNSPALHYVAQRFGFWLKAPVSLTLNPDYTESLKLMRLFQQDSHLDSCVCACSRHGCCVVTRLVQGSSNFDTKRHLHPSKMLPTWYEHIHSPLGIDAMFDANADALFRAITFEALKIEHTCDHYETPKDLEEIKEIQFEWEESIQLLEELTDEFIFAYEQSNLSIFDFLEGYWNVRMEGIIFPSRSSRRKEIHQLRKIGIILDDDHATEDEESEEQSGEGSEEEWEEESEWDSEEEDENQMSSIEEHP
ncbi:hypothetical protein N7540_009135 [Penicillium herquei]|nr:hypothetical protein N7540_009135 [Penicillium herquei]